MRGRENGDVGSLLHPESTAKNKLVVLHYICRVVQSEFVPMGQTVKAKPVTL